ncbi:MULTISPECIES: nitroreductase family protein [Acinetobacter]|jgi:nitroreductase|uniref:Putative NAD(P)H nitroreductase n=1 Tax=Acinetobacter chengduensis TaxID=2420890 RepID=A0ABX9TW04_9GAMM|nr:MULTISPECIES: nitroreductase family protein [Acinetobacter]MBI1450548.1 nitroreductase family protein [Acinetobacter sp. FL51]RLL22034.1 nitroreductase [Acinetobacter chengduensis]
MSESAVEIVHQNIHQRQSIGHLVEPAPNAVQLEQAFQAAMTAPDHHRLKPTRFVVIPSTEREAFGDLLSQALADTGQTEEAQLERVKNHPFRAPLLVLALTKLQDHPKVPHFEQILSSGAAVQNFLLSLQSNGYSTMWRSGAVVESKLFKQALGLTEADLISGIIYIGTAVKAIPPRTEIFTNEFVSEWHK